MSTRLFGFVFFVMVALVKLNAQNVMHIDVEQAHFKEIDAEIVFDDLEIIPLETHEGALLNVKNGTYYLTDEYIIAIRFLQGAYLFDRKTGNFVREISTFGQGPDEYTGWIYDRCGYDEENIILYACDNPRKSDIWKGFNIKTNKLERTIRRPFPKEDDPDFLAYAPWRIKDDLYLSFCNNRTGKDKIKLVVYNKEGVVIQKYLNHLEYEKKNMQLFPANNGIFYYYNGLTYFKEWSYNDTVFCVTEKNISPHIIFKLGKKQSSYYHQDDATYNKGKYLINFVHESASFVLFNFLYYTETIDVPGSNMGKNETVLTGYYDKKKKQAYISSTPDLRSPGYVIKGIPVRFYPIYVNKNNEIVARICPEELMRHRDKIDAKYKHLFQDLQEDDNPIIVIAKLKK